MTKSMSRRAAMRAAGVSAALLAGRKLGAGLLDSVARAQGQTTPFVDPHCHIFNVSDLPLGGFLHHVIVRDKAPRIYKGLVAEFTKFPKVPVFIDFVAKILAREYKDEEKIDALAPGSFQYLSAADPDWAIADQKMLRKLLLSIRLIDPPPGNSLGFTLPPEFKNNRDFVTAAKAISFLISVATSFTDDKNTRSRDMLKSLVRFEKADPDNWSAIELALNDVVHQVFEIGGTEISRTIRWLLTLMRGRTAILRELDLLTPSSSLPGRYRFYTPALVDFDYWLNEEVVEDDPINHPAESFSIGRQVSLMEKLSVAQPPGYALNGLVAFDPLRAAIQWRESGKATKPRALSDVEDAVLRRGFVGVKLYPPMGFWPWDNKGNIKDFYNDITSYGPSDMCEGFGLRAARHFSKWPDTKVPLDESPSANGYKTKRDKALDEQAACIDDVLTQLYDFCLENDVPIMAHCSRGQGSFDAGKRFTSERRSQPKYWKALLEVKDRKYRELRLNLGHMGGVWCLGAPYDPKHDNREKTTEQETTWEYEAHYCDLTDSPPTEVVGKDGKKEVVESPFWTERLYDMIAADDGQGNPIYPNLYADLSDWEEFLLKETAARDGATALKDLLGGGRESGYKRRELIPNIYSHIRLRAERVRSRLMYGTDFILLGRAPDHGKYFERVSGGLRDVFTAAAEYDGFLGGNALRFMGLTPNSKGEMDRPMQRLVEFYVRNKLPAKANEILAAFGHTTRVPA